MHKWIQSLQRAFGQNQLPKSLKFVSQQITTMKQSSEKKTTKNKKTERKTETDPLGNWNEVTRPYKYEKQTRVVK